MQIKDHLYSERVPFLLFSWPFGKRYELVKIFFFPCQKKERGKNLLLLKYPLMHEFQVRTTRAPEASSQRLPGQLPGWETVF